MRNVSIIAILISMVFYAGVSHAQDMKDARIRIEQGNFTNKQSVGLELTATTAKMMALSEKPNLENARWIPFHAKTHWMLSDGDGRKVIYAQFKDEAGNKSEIVSDKIIFDTTPPQNAYVKIDIPTKYFTEKNTNEIGVIIEAEGAKFYMISNEPSFHGFKWKLKQDDYIDWTLAEGDDGPRSIHVKFRDQAGNETKVYHDQVIIDRTAPFGGKIMVNNGDKFTIRQDKKVNAKMFCRFADSMMVAQNKQFVDGKWEKYSTHHEFILEGDDGVKDIFIKFKDKAGNESAIASTSIVLDVTPPQNPDVKINNGMKETDNINKLVSLQLRAADAKLMLISNHPSFSSAKWQKYQPVLEDWSLGGEADGKKRVYVKFKDEAGNISRPVVGEIYLKRGY